MIFVILGIVVLVASFLIALVSLIREQGKLVEEAKRSKAEDTFIADSPNANDKAVPQPGAGVVLDKHGGDTAAAGKPAINRPLFPWEEGKYQAAGNVTDADREKVEVLRAQLAELKSRVAVKSQKEDKVEVPVVKPKEEARDYKGQQGLSGEISIADLKRQ
ncbi:MAG: hypothetical protein UV59_C0030G0004 [Candidatus Gottesmanbacteria bacterium GW2011_GWA1_43_11]|uniref:Uncharacterized protein n=1 Tax=Candidatus Gottesmanbacteria bacterium GW2011_GWA1_43_11 TaxID=1618436 RepID=A0A0G1ELE8_9BACT|nr:MAG: hypothetical protein UV59_C0030G0004 [Candidatus Gottesmanbacteria bacterium GW2011_GWA1_43_11]